MMANTTKERDLCRFVESYQVDQRVFFDKATIVSFGHSLLTQKKVIIKCIETQEYKKLKEINILKKLEKVPGVINYIDHFYFSPIKQVMVTEFFGDGTLARFITQFAPVSENTTHIIIKQLITAAQACYNLNILHRKINSSNILIDVRNLQIKLHNFDTACIFDKEIFEAPLSQNSAPPEYFTAKRYTANGYYVWTLGLILYELLFNKKPFDSKEAVITKSCLAKTSKPIDINAFVLVGWMLMKNPSFRICLKQLTYHPWISKKWA
jgi:serine/threonine protein kinase